MKTEQVHSLRRVARWANLSGAAVLCATTFLPAAAFGIAIRIPNQDAEAIARGNAFAATADNPAAIYYNPAGISQLSGQHFDVGVLNYLGINTYYDAPGGSSTQSKFEIVPIPQIYYTFSPTNFPVSFGLGVYAPFGLGVEWPEDSGFRSIAIESRLQYMTLNPVVAWKIVPQLSIAAGPTVNYSKLMFRRGLVTTTDRFKFEGDDISLGFNAGVLWQPISQWSFGLNYRSPSTMNYDGTTSYNPGSGVAKAGTTARIPFPQIISGGVSYRPTEKWNIEVDVDWTDWNTVDTVRLKGTSAIFGTDLPLQLNWHASWLYELGVTRFLDNNWFVSAGYFYCSDTTSDQFFTPAVPDTKLHVGSVGFGHKGQRWDWAVAAQLIAGPERNIKNSQPNPFTGESGNGRYRLFIPTISVSLGYHF